MSAHTIASTKNETHIVLLSITFEVLSAPGEETRNTYFTMTCNSLQKQKVLRVYRARQLLSLDGDVGGRPFIMLRVTFKILTPPSPLHTNGTHFYTETLGEMLR